MDQIPIDLNGRDPSASTVFVGNVGREVNEIDLLTLFNSVNGKYGRRQHNIVAAVNFAYREGKFNGQAYFMYTTVAIADYVVDVMHDVNFCGRRLYVRHSDRRLDTGGVRRGNVLGRSRSGAAIWERPPRTKVGEPRRS